MITNNVNINKDEYAMMDELLNHDDFFEKEIHPQLVIMGDGDMTRDEWRAGVVDTIRHMMAEPYVVLKLIENANDHDVDVIFQNAIRIYG